MARPKGSEEELKGRRKQALALHSDGISIPEIAGRLQCTPTAVRKWLRDSPEWDFVVEQRRAWVFARLNTEGSAANETGGRYTAWTTEALPFAFGQTFDNEFVDDELEDLTLDFFTNTLIEWNCYQDEHGVWRTPSAD